MKNTTLIVSVLALALAACGDNLNSDRIDAREIIDSPPGTPDASIDAGGPDAMVDAMTSNVTVTTGACPGTPAIQLTTAPAAGTNAFRIMGSGVNNPDLVLMVGESIEFAPSAANTNHNFSATAPGFGFRSGDPGAHTACITFTAATAPNIVYRCEVHPGAMNAMLTVN